MFRNRIAVGHPCDVIQHKTRAVGRIVQAHGRVAPLVGQPVGMIQVQRKQVVQHLGDMGAFDDDRGRAIHALEQEGISGVSIKTKSDISMDKEGDGFAVKKAHLTTTITADADQAKILEVAEKAKEGCPISKLLNAEITMDASVS